MNHKKTLIAIIALLAILIVAAAPTSQVAAATTNAKLALKFVDSWGNALKNAYVKVFNTTDNDVSKHYVLFDGRTDSNGWLNVTIPKPYDSTTYNMTVWWDPAGTNYFYVFAKSGITGNKLKDKPLNAGYNCTEGGYIVTSVVAVKITVNDISGNVLDYYTTTVYYNRTGKVYSAQKKPASNILIQVPYNLSWTGGVDWTLRVYWDLEYLNFTTTVSYDGTYVTWFNRFTDIRYANFTVYFDKSVIGPKTAPVGTGTLTVRMDVRPFATQLVDWFGNKLNVTSGYGIVKVMVHDANDPSKLLATMIANGTGYVTFPQIPNVKSTIVVYWLTHEITVNTTTVTDLATPLTSLRCQLVPAVLTLNDKRPSPSILANAKVYVTWPNLLTHDTKSNLVGVVQLPPYSDDVARLSMATGDVNATGKHGSGYLPFGNTKVDVYWSITPEQPASWVNVRSATISISSAGSGKINVKLDGTTIESGFYGNVLGVTLTCNVFDAMLNVVDLNGTPLVSPTVVLQHPTGAVSMVTASPGGALTLIQVPGGDWRVSVVYKNVQFKPYGMSDVFSINTNIYSAVTFKFPYVSASLKFVKWGSDTFAIPGLNVTLSWTGNSTVAGTSGVTYKEAWKGTSTEGWANFTQIPVGVSVTVDAWANSSKSWFGITKDIDVGPYETPITLTPANYIGTFHVYIYDVKVNFCDVKGSLMPSTLPYSMAVTIVSDTGESKWWYANFTNANSLFYYTTFAGTTGHMYVGSAKYKFEVYWAGVRVFNGTITVPTVTDPAKTYAELNVNLRVYPVSFAIYNWKHTTALDNLNVTFSWLAANMTTLNSTVHPGTVYSNGAKPSEAETWVYGNVVTATTFDSTKHKLYMVMLKYSGENLVYIPVWMAKDEFGTPVSLVVQTIPGETVGVPKDVSRSAVGFFTAGDFFINGSSGWKPKLFADGLKSKVNDKIGVTAGVLNFTGVATQWSPVWSYSNYVFDLKVAAYDMTAKVTDWTDTGLASYTVDAYWNKTAGKYYLVASSLTDGTGKATFSTIFWGNATSYLFRAYRKPLAGELPSDLSVTLADDIIVYANVVANKDDIVTTMKFSNYIGLQALSANGKPLYKVFAGTPKYGLVYAIRYTPVKDTVSGTTVPAGTIAAFGYVDSTGKVYMPFALATGNYTTMVRWLGVDVYNSYDKEVFYKIVKPTVFYTAFTDVFDVSYRLTDDVGRNLAGLTYTFAGGEYSVSGKTGTDGTFSTDLVPRGSYKITALWPRKDIKVLDIDVTVTGNLVEVPIKCKVYDATLVVKTPKGTLLTAATVSVKYPDDTTATATTTPAGEVKFTQIPIGTLTVTGVTWLGKSITVTPASLTVDKTGVYTLTTTNVYTLTVKVVGARGQGLGPTAVSIAPLGISVETDESGVASVEVPAGTYTVAVNYRGIEDSRSVSVTADKTETFGLDVFATIFGRPFRTAEFFGELILLPIVIIVVLYLIFYEYTVWRRKRLAVVPPTK